MNLRADFENSLSKLVDFFLKFNCYYFSFDCCWSVLSWFRNNKNWKGKSLRISHPPLSRIIKYPHNLRLIEFFVIIGSNLYMLCVCPHFFICLFLATVAYIFLCAIMCCILCVRWAYRLRVLMSLLLLSLSLYSLAGSSLFSFSLGKHETMILLHVLYP